jgi:hypothetical protein
VIEDLHRRKQLANSWYEDIGAIEVAAVRAERTNIDTAIDLYRHCLSKDPERKVSLEGLARTIGKGFQKIKDNNYIAVGVPYRDLEVSLTFCTKPRRLITPRNTLLSEEEVFKHFFPSGEPEKAGLLPIDLYVATLLHSTNYSEGIDCRKEFFQQIQDLPEITTTSLNYGEDNGSKVLTSSYVNVNYTSSPHDYQYTSTLEKRKFTGLIDQFMEGCEKKYGASQLDPLASIMLGQLTRTPFEENNRNSDRDQLMNLFDRMSRSLSFEDLGLKISDGLITNFSYPNHELETGTHRLQFIAESTPEDPCIGITNYSELDNTTTERWDALVFPTRIINITPKESDFVVDSLAAAKQRVCQKLINMIEKNTRK